MSSLFGYDMDTFSGRFMHFIRVVNPINCFYKEVTLNEYKQKVDTFEFIGLKNLNENELKEYTHMTMILASSINPDSKNTIPWPMRTSSFVPTNIPIISGMLLTAPTPFNTFLW